MALKKMSLGQIKGIAALGRSKHKTVQDFLGSPVVKNLPANAGDTGLIPGPGRSHMPWGN